LTRPVSAPAGKPTVAIAPVARGAGEQLEQRLGCLG
jgi:hypothetical protein